MEPLKFSLPCIIKATFLITYIYVTSNVAVPTAACYIPTYPYPPYPRYPTTSSYPNSVTNKPTKNTITRKPNIRDNPGSSTPKPDTTRSSTKYSSTSTTEEIETTTKKTCSIWCWLRKVGLFVVQELLKDDD